jgi:hypothetical protein
MIYYDSAVIVIKLLLHASSRAYSGADASEYLLIIMHGENLMYQEQKD